LNAQDQGRIIRGTVNVVLANSNGMVVLTDSTGTLSDSAGKRVGSKASQKLIRLDGHSVCAIAGFGSATTPTRLQFSTDVIAILSDFRDQLAAKKEQLSFDYKLRSLSFLIKLYIQGFANITEVLYPGVLKREQLSFTLFLVGYDSDKKPKIGSLALTATPETLPAGKVSWQFAQSIGVEDVGDGLKNRIGGMWDVGTKIIREPQAYSDDPAARKYLESAKNNGETLDLTDLEALAKFIAAETSRKHPHTVGGPDQIAIFQDNQIVKFEQQPFPATHKPMSVALIMDVPLNFGPGGGTAGPKGGNTIWIRNTIVGYQGLMLDGNFFLGNEIRDSVVRYSGGQAEFDSSNKVVNSKLQISTLVGPNAGFAYDLVQNFPWTRVFQ
jgi:hypothetical protein